MQSEKSINKKLYNNNHNEILYISFNQDNSCVSIGTELGFKIIKVCPFLDLYYRDMNGGIGIIEMLNQSNILALVGGGKKPKYPNNEFNLWDEEKEKELVKIKTNTKILNIKIRENKIYIVNQNKILVFDINTLSTVNILQTKNPRGLISICYKIDMVAYPDIAHEGTILIRNYEKNTESKLKAHKTQLTIFQINQDGTLIGTCSLKGTIIRVYNIANNQMVREVRRGKDSAHLNCISFDISKKYFLVGSDTKTIHVFFLINQNEDDKNELKLKHVKTKSVVEVNNKKSIFCEMSNFFNVGKRYFASEWGFAKFKTDSSKAICVFGPDNSIYTVGFDGKFCQEAFDPVNGDIFKIQEEQF